MDYGTIGFAPATIEKRPALGEIPQTAVERSETTPIPVELTFGKSAGFLDSIAAAFFGYAVIDLPVTTIRARKSIGVPLS